ncbi:ArsR/SmtB family transcription factor [Brevibacillus migulae]|uniref:ArsR/SmtB family transcription factor n=1 Tax=Brevibacillus migulae TaxID=1644114 RepID=UPI00106DD9FC|nr:winged helix-turn-helix domain-containing protein [Brevibacillus migulae]
MKEQYSIKIEYSPAYELVLSFYHYIYHRHMKAPRLDGQWRALVEQRLPASFAQELQDERWEVLHRMVLLISQCPKKTTVEDFLHWLEKLPPGEIYERLAPWVETIPLNLGEIRDRSLYLLSEWNLHYFRSLDAEILLQLEGEGQKWGKEALVRSSVDLIEEVTNGMRIEPSAQLDTIIVVPQYHCAPATILDFFRGVATCLFPVPEVGSEHSMAGIKLVAQCLADDKRLEILQLLTQGPHSLIELHKKLGLAKSTVHHHITALRRAGMIRAHFLDHTTPAFYSLRPVFMERFSRELQQHFSLEGSNS